MRMLLLLQLALAWIFVYEGSGKLFGWFGGSGIESVIGYFASLGIPFPKLSAYLVGCAEFAAGLCFLSGFLVRPASSVVAVIMVTAIFTAHRQGGYNYPLLILCASLLLLETGGRSILEFLRKIAR